MSALGEELARQPSPIRSRMEDKFYQVGIGADYIAQQLKDSEVDNDVCLQKDILFYFQSMQNGTRSQLISL